MRKRRSFSIENATYNFMDDYISGSFCVYLEKVKIKQVWINSVMLYSNTIMVGWKFLHKSQYSIF